MELLIPSTLCPVKGEHALSSGLSQGGASLDSVSPSVQQEGESHSEALGSVGWRSQFMGFTALVLFTLCTGSSFVFEYRVVTNQACFGELVHIYFESPLVFAVRLLACSF